MDRQIFARWFAILSLCCLCQAVQAKDWYVDNVAGDDLWNGARSRGTYDREGPFHSIGRALQYVSPVIESCWSRMINLITSVLA